MNMITIDAHSRDMVANIADAGEVDADCFLWMCQLRSYWDAKLGDCRWDIKQGAPPREPTDPSGRLTVSAMFCGGGHGTHTRKVPALCMFRVQSSDLAFHWTRFPLCLYSVGRATC